MNAKFKAENEMQLEKISLLEKELKQKDDSYWELNVKYVHLSKNAYLSKK